MTDRENQRERQKDRKTEKKKKERKKESLIEKSFILNQSLISMAVRIITKQLDRLKPVWDLHKYARIYAARLEHCVRYRKSSI